MSLAQQAVDVLAHVRRVIERSGHPGLVEQVDQRIPDGTAAGWQLLPAMAVAARLAARGEGSAVDAERARRR